MQLIEGMSQAITYFMAEETGASIIEYLLAGLLFAVVLTLAFLAFGKNA
jgi:Flp pilus assembly pilin Flp